MDKLRKENEKKAGWMNSVHLMSFIVNPTTRNVESWSPDA